ncbi:uncharacterized protein LOC124169305 isoform X2 [Ischnura elegans]|uniref:uncharacterized protein LOC124169305 isoform X2 n=1 Tax=Ischnura elegans TaxID=197161 RepID=UPI001ED8AB1E|nr:uncharacterized protein LOC124169305 isoform X2 [Ischnura elegans]
MKRRGTLTTSTWSNISSAATASQSKKQPRMSPDDEEIPSYDLTDYLEVEMSSEDSSPGEESDTDTQSETDSDREPGTSTSGTPGSTLTGSTNSNDSFAVWTVKPPQTKPSIPFLGAPGLKARPTAPTPRAYFTMVFTEKIYDIVIQATQKNAEDLILKNSSPRGRVTNWKPLSMEELNIWLGLLFHMGTIKIDRLKDYWKTSKFFNIPIFRESMPRDRFLGILQALSFSKSSKEAEHASTDKLYKITPLLNGFREAMETAVSPERELCIDESILLWRRQLICQQYQQNTRSKHGIRMHMLSESWFSTSNINSFRLYRQKSRWARV